MAKKKQAPAETRALDTGMIDYYRLDSLHVSPHNVRKVDINDLGALRSSIIEQGLLQPLVVYDKDELGYVAAGQRRLLAMQGLMRDSVLAPETMVPVRKVDETTAIEVSLAENIERKQMNPADEVRAFKALVDTGAHNAETIAKRFGYAVKFVRQRLKLAGLPPQILDTLEQRQITLDAAEAYASASIDVAASIFAEHEKRTYNAHDPATIRSDINYVGIDADGRIGKFIGGMKAYKAAGGTMLDEDFLDLFTLKDGTDTKLRDRTVIDRLIEAKQAKIDKQVMKLALDELPFVTGYEWVSLGTNQYGGDKPPKCGADFVTAKTGWDSTASKYVEFSDLKKVGKKAAEKEGATVLAVITLDNDGQPTVSKDMLIIGKNAWTKLRPKPTKQDEDRGPSSSRMSDEELAAHNRRVRIRQWAELLLGRSLIGETPGWGVTGVDEHRDGNITLRLTSAQPFDDSLFDTDEYSNKRFADATLEPFMAEAEAKVDAAAEADRAAKEAAAAAAQEEQDAADALLDELELTAVEDWPVRVEIDCDHGTIIIHHHITEPDFAHVLECTTPDGECWQTDNVLELLGTLRDSLVDSTYSVTREEGTPATIPEDRGEGIEEAYDRMGGDDAVAEAMAEAAADS